MGTGNVFRVTLLGKPGSFSYRYISAVEASQNPWRSISSSRNVIAMSLYGDNRRYTIGALRNAQLLPIIFPGWRLWFYCEKPLPDGSVKYGKTPEKILRKITELGAEIRYVDAAITGLAPMLWRFLVAEDLDVDAFVVRDCDSRLTPRDAAVISDWLKTNASFHCIRDHPSHSHYSVSGGLWGGRPKLLRSILNGTMRSMMRRYGSGYLADMNFLGADIWPKVKDFAFCHDSFSCQSFPASHPFPVKRIGYEHLGQVYDENSIGRQGDINILKSAPVNDKCVPSA